MPIKTLTDGTEYIKAVHQNEKTLKGTWDITYKIDGVRAIRNEHNEVVSRNSKPLYNLDGLEFADAEIFRKNWETSVSLVRSQQPKCITQSDVYELLPLDKRLETGITLIDPTHKQLMTQMHVALSLGYEGIVVRGVNAKGVRQWIKYVPEITADVRVTGHVLSTKRLGYIKNFTTAHGNISATSFNVEQLEAIKEDGADYYTGKIMEVAFREKTPAGKMRFGKFTRWRFDKDEESFT